LDKIKDRQVVVDDYWKALIKEIRVAKPKKKVSMVPSNYMHSKLLRIRARKRGKTSRKANA
jgi:hypothetical protein